MKTMSRSLTQILSVAAVLALALGVNYLYASTWTGPSATAPGNNIAAPVNTGSVAQVKDGNLSVGASGNATNTLGLSIIGRVYSSGWITVGSNAIPTEPIDIRGVPGVHGLRFPDGTIQYTAATTATSSSGHSCPQWQTSFGQNVQQQIRCGVPGTNSVFRAISEASGKVQYRDGQTSNPCDIFYNANTGNYMSMSGGCPAIANCQTNIDTVKHDSINCGDDD